MKEIFTRTSIRQYKDREVEQEKIEKILRAAMQAPTAVNQQPWVFYVVRNKDVKKQLSEVHPYAKFSNNAPVIIVIGYKKNVTLPSHCQIDCSIAAENIYLEAEALGLGACMLGVAPEEDRMAYVEKVLNMPEDTRAFTLFPIGYPVEKKSQQDRYDEKKVFYVD